MEQVFQNLLAQGPLGLLCAILLYALRAERKRYDDLRNQYDEVQKARIADTQAMVAKMTESGKAFEDAIEYLNSRRR